MRPTHLAAIVALVLVGPVVAAPVAYAHTELVSASPAEGATVSVAPERVALRFSEDVDGRFADLVLVVNDGEPVPLEVSARGGASATVTATVPVDEVAASVGADPAQWQVAYRVTSADGHPIQGSVDFVVSAPAAPVLPTAPTDSPISTTGAQPVQPPAPSTPVTSGSSEESVSGQGSGSGTSAGPGDSSLGATVALGAVSVVVFLVMALLITRGMRRRDAEDRS